MSVDGYHVHACVRACVCVLALFTTVKPKTERVVLACTYTV